MGAAFKYYGDTELILIRFLWGYIFYALAATLIAAYHSLSSPAPFALSVFWDQLVQYTLPVLDPNNHSDASAHSLMLLCLLTAIGLAALAWVVFFILGKNCKCFQKFDVYKKYLPIAQYGGPLEEFFVRMRMSSDFFRPVMIILKNRKVYIGCIRELSLHNRNKRTLSIIPIYSGYLTTDKLQVQKDVDYSIIFNALNYMVENNLKKAADQGHVGAQNCLKNTYASRKTP